MKSSCIAHKHVDILSEDKHPSAYLDFVKNVERFRLTKETLHPKNVSPAVEYCRICRYLDGERGLIPNRDFSEENLILIQKLENPRFK